MGHASAHLLIHEPALAEGVEEGHENVAVERSFGVAGREGGEDGHAFADLRVQRGTMELSQCLVESKRCQNAGEQPKRGRGDEARTKARVRRRGKDEPC